MGRLLWNGPGRNTITFPGLHLSVMCVHCVGARIRQHGIAAVEWAGEEQLLKFGMT